MVKKKWSILAFIILVVQTCHTGFINKYTVDMEQVDICPGNERMETPIRNLKFIFLNRTRRALNFDLNLLHPLDENVGTAMQLYRWSEGSWIDTPFVPFQRNMCTSMNKFFKSSWLTFTKALGVPNPDKCPIPAGNYTLRNLIFDMNAFKIPFWSGRFKLMNIIRRMDNKRDVYCLMFIVKIAEIV